MKKNAALGNVPIVKGPDGVWRYPNASPTDEG